MELTKKRTEAVLKFLSKKLGWIIAASDGWPVSEGLIDQFNAAAKLSRAGKHKEALAAWEQLLSPAAPDANLSASTTFVATCMLRRAYVLMDLNEFDAARQAFESDELRALLDGAPEDLVGQYYFSYGNTLRALGEEKLAEKMLRRAAAPHS